MRELDRMLAAGAAIACIAVVTSSTPATAFDLFCTYDLNYRLTATIEVDGRQYTSSVIRRQTRSRDWIYNLNSNGCRPTHGTALAFRLSDNRAVLAPTRICNEARETFAAPPRSAPSYARAMSEQRSVDLMKACRGTIAGPGRPPVNSAPAFLLDNADKPTQWWGFQFGDRVEGSTIRLMTATAQALHAEPADALDSFPGVLDSRFEHRNPFNSPEAIIPSERRSKRPRPFSNRVAGHEPAN
jgi:hypothetical protein